MDIRHSKQYVNKKGFHEKYLDNCKKRNQAALVDVREKFRNSGLLDFHCDRLRVSEWKTIFESLKDDFTLKSVAVRLRKNKDIFIESADSITKAKKVVNHPTIMTHYILVHLMESLSSLLTSNSVLTTLLLEGLPLSGRYMSVLVKGIRESTSLKSLAFSRSLLDDEAVELICSSVKYLPNIETLDFSHCNLNFTGATSIVNMLKFQKIQRFAESWERSLRYGSINHETIPGLINIFLNFNPDLGDESLEMILEVLKEDVWIKKLEMKGCGLTDLGAEQICKCLKMNETLITFEIDKNPDISNTMYKRICVKLGAETSAIDEESTKLSNAQLLDKINRLEDNLAHENFEKIQAQNLYIQFFNKVTECQNEISRLQIPDGYTLIEKKILESLLKQENELKQCEITNHETDKISEPEMINNKVVVFPENKPKRRIFKKSKSHMHSKKVHKTSKKSKSEPIISRPTTATETEEDVHIEKYIGDGINFQSVMGNAEKLNQKLEDDILSLFSSKLSFSNGDGIKCQRVVEDVEKLEQKEEEDILDFFSSKLNFPNEDGFNSESVVQDVEKLKQNDVDEALSLLSFSDGASTLVFDSWKTSAPYNSDVESLESF